MVALVFLQQSLDAGRVEQVLKVQEGIFGMIRCVPGGFTFRGHAHGSYKLPQFPSVEDSCDCREHAGSWNQ